MWIRITDPFRNSNKLIGKEKRNACITKWNSMSEKRTTVDTIINFINFWPNETPFATFILCHLLIASFSPPFIVYNLVVVRLRYSEWHKFKILQRETNRVLCILIPAKAELNEIPFWEEFQVSMKYFRGSDECCGVGPVSITLINWNLFHLIYTRW